MRWLRQKQSIMLEWNLWFYRTSINLLHSKHYRTFGSQSWWTEAEDFGIPSHRICVVVLIRIAAYEKKNTCAHFSRYNFSASLLRFVGERRNMRWHIRMNKHKRKLGCLQMNTIAQWIRSSRWLIVANRLKTSYKHIKSIQPVYITYESKNNGYTELYLGVCLCVWRVCEWIWYAELLYFESKSVYVCCHMSLYLSTMEKGNSNIAQAHTIYTIQLRSRRGQESEQRQIPLTCTAQENQFLLRI